MHEELIIEGFSLEDKVIFQTRVGTIEVKICDYCDGNKVMFNINQKEVECISCHGYGTMESICGEPYSKTGRITEFLINNRNTKVEITYHEDNTGRVLSVLRDIHEIELKDE